MKSDTIGHNKQIGKDIIDGQSMITAERIKTNEYMDIIIFYISSLNSLLK